jgi:hypothetical protein
VPSLCPGGVPRSVAEHPADRLAEILARGYQIPADVHRISAGEDAVSVYFGLVARTDGHLIWWVVPNQGQRRRPLWTYATTPETAALRLARHYEQLRRRPIADIVGGLPLLTDLILDRHDCVSR